jgi:hypothetical protein
VAGGGGGGEVNASVLAARLLAWLQIEVLFSESSDKVGSVARAYYRCAWSCLALFVDCFKGRIVLGRIAFVVEAQLVSMHVGKCS